MRHADRPGPTSLLLGLELAFGVALLGAATVAGLVFVHRPGLNRLDAFAYNALPPDQGSHVLHDIALLGSLEALVIGIGIAIATSIWRDLARTAACAVGPLVAVLITEQVAKPFVGRPAYLGGYSYPSGTVTAAAALATVFVLASPRLFRPLAVVLGLGAIAAVSAAVIAMRWHFATDTFGGACVGTGSVFTLDALFHLPGNLRTQLRESRARSASEGHFLQRV
ncbi:MAG TPA: phosphatase PAP2 family protein [Acidimicrobiales bacterium]|nr:phosphatase PAP2 family protein [Acidimicrobiales bacterium]